MAWRQWRGGIAGCVAHKQLAYGIISAAQQSMPSKPAVVKNADWQSGASTQIMAKLEHGVNNSNSVVRKPA